MKNNTGLREEKFAMICRWEQSGLNQRQFCQSENIPFNHFYYWLKRYRDQGNDKAVGFIKLKSDVKPGFTGEIFSEVVFSNGNTVRFYRSVDGAVLKQLAC